MYNTVSSVCPRETIEDQFDSSQITMSSKGVYGGVNYEKISQSLSTKIYPLETILKPLSTKIYMK